MTAATAAAPTASPTDRARPRGRMIATTASKASSPAREPVRMTPATSTTATTIAHRRRRPWSGRRRHRLTTSRQAVRFGFSSSPPTRIRPRPAASRATPITRITAAPRRIAAAARTPRWLIRRAVIHNRKAANQTVRTSLAASGAVRARTPAATPQPRKTTTAISSIWRRSRRQYTAAASVTARQIPTAIRGPG